MSGMTLSPASSQPAGLAPGLGEYRRPPWLEDLDDGPLSENAGTEADVTRAMVADEEIMLEEEAVPSAQYELVETTKLLCAGGLAGAVSKSATAPLARLTILYQVQGLRACPTPPLSQGVLSAMSQIVRGEGFRALWRGNGVTIVHRLPYSAANFWVYEQVNERWKRSGLSTLVPGGDLARRFVSGGMAGLTACSLAYPLDLVRTRLAAQLGQGTDAYYRGIGGTLRTIIRDEGARGLYRGLGATLGQVAPALAINYAAYETLRALWLARAGGADGQRLPPGAPAPPSAAVPSVFASLACGAAAGIVSSSATFPLDLVRRRLQLQGQGGGALVYPTYGSAVRGIWRAEGARGFYAGILPEYYKVVPGVAIAFCTYELLKRALGVQTNATDR